MKTKQNQIKDDQNTGETLLELPEMKQEPRITTGQGIRWLTNQLNRPQQSFRTSETYKLLKLELTKRGNWKLQKRGRPTPSNLIDFRHTLTKGKR